MVREAVMSLHAVSLFTGIGGIDLAFERAGVPTIVQCEADKAARSVLARRFPHVTLQHHDVQELTADDLRSAGADSARTVLTGGFPCQDLSVAGGRRGMGEGTRSGLFWHIPRILAEFPAAWVVLENVAGLLSSHGGRDMGAVIGALGDLGYGIAWRVLDAQHFGVPQRRRRVVIVGHLGAPWGAPAEILLEPEGGGGDSAPLGEAGSGATGGPAGRVGGRRVASALTAHHGRMTAEDADNLGTYQKVIRSGYRAADGTLPPEVWAERSVSSTLSPFDLTSESRAVDLVVCATGDRTHALTAEGHDAGEDGSGRGTPIIAATLIAGTSSPGVSAPGRRQEDEHNLVAFHLTQDPISGDVVPALGSKSGGNGVATETVVRRLTPLECERLQGFPDGWTDGQADSPRYKQLGNAVAVPVFEWVARRLVAIDARITSAPSCIYSKGEK